MPSPSPRHFVILGNGITGITVARHLRKRGQDRITVISGETAVPYSRPALMYVFMGDLRFEDTKLYEDDFWSKNRIDLVQDWVEGIEPTSKRLRLRRGGHLSYDELVLATGSKPNRFGWPGQDLHGVQSLYHWQDVLSLEENVRHAKRAVITGGGLIGIELAEMLLTRDIPVTYLVREENFWGSVLPEEEAKLVNREVRAHGIDLRLRSEMREILPDANGRARAVVTTGGEEIPCQLVGITVGVQPNIALAKDAGIECDRGILVDRFFRTGTAGIWSAGDCAQHRTVPPGRRPVEQVWYTGKIQGEHLAANLCGEERAYEPGIWFNSAKFFDLEYQTYGTILNRPGPGEDTFVWKDPSRDRLLRINFRAESGAVTGVNVFGIRHRQAVWETWIRTGTAVGDVVANLAAANFDPEFFHAAEPTIRAAFAERFPDRVATRAVPARKGLFTTYFKSLSKPTPA